MNPQHPRDPLHGITLAKMLEELLAHHGWDGLGRKIPIRCFTSNPSIRSSLTFLRRTPWAREKVETLYLGYLLEKDEYPDHEKAGKRVGAELAFLPVIDGTEHGMPNPEEKP